MALSTPTIQKRHQRTSRSRQPVSEPTIHSGTMTCGHRIFWRLTSFQPCTSKAPGSNRPETYSMTGDLTIRGNTHPVTFKVVKYGEFNDPHMMGHRIGYN